MFINILIYVNNPQFNINITSQKYTYLNYKEYLNYTQHFNFMQIFIINIIKF